MHIFSKLFFLLIWYTSMKSKEVHLKRSLPSVVGGFERSEVWVEACQVLESWWRWGARLEHQALGAKRKAARRLLGLPTANRVIFCLI